MSKAIIVKKNDTMSGLGAIHDFNYRKAKVIRKGQTYSIADGEIDPNYIFQGDHIVPEGQPIPTQVQHACAAVDELASDTEVEETHAKCCEDRKYVLDGGHKFIGLADDHDNDPDVIRYIRYNEPDTGKMYIFAEDADFGNLEENRHNSLLEKYEETLNSYFFLSEERKAGSIEERRTHYQNSRDKRIENLLESMEKTVKMFSHADTTGMANELFENFKNSRNISSRKTFTHDGLNNAASQHKNGGGWLDRVLNHPDSSIYNSGVVRLHQALKEKEFDINAINELKDMGTSGFTNGSKVRQTEDYAFGLGVLIGGFQYADVYVKSYIYNECKKTYNVTIMAYLYDVFGIDRRDIIELPLLARFSDARAGIVAWRELQTDYGFVPPITKITIEKSYSEMPAS